MGSGELNIYVVANCFYLQLPFPRGEFVLPSLSAHTCCVVPINSKNCSDSIFFKKKKMLLPPEDKYSIKDSQTCSNLVPGFKRGGHTALIESP